MKILLIFALSINHLNIYTMRTITNLTEMETKVLNSLADSMYAEWGFSDYGFTELCSELDLNIKILRGVVGSLVKKKLVWVEQEEGVDIIYLTNEAEGLVPHWVENNEDLEATQII